MKGRPVVDVSMGLGLAALGRPGYLTLGHGRDLSSTTVDDLRDQTHDVLDAAWAAGIRYVDVARSYGLAERFLGEWMAAHPGRREKLTIGSKWGYTYTADWRRDAPVPEVKDHSLAAFERQWPETLDALGGPPDIYLIHSLTCDSGALDDPALLTRLAGLCADGVTIGLSSSGPDQARVIGRALALSDAGTVPFRVVQATWNLLEPSVGRVLDIAHRAGWFVVVKEALANGRLTDRGGIEALGSAAQHAGTTPDALALSAVAQQPFTDVVLSGATSVTQLRSNLGALDIERPIPAADLAEQSEHYWQTRARLPWT